MKLYFALIFLLVTTPALASLGERMNVIIDAGHGGNDKGAVTSVNSNLIKESDLTLKLSKKIISLIDEKYSHEIKAHATRTKNNYLSLSQRIQSYKNEPVDLYISLHYNSTFSESISGAEIYFPEENKPRASLSVVEAIKQDLIETGRIKKSLHFSSLLTPEWKSSPLKIRRAPFYILDKSPSPAILIEVGYLTNPAEQKKLLSAQNQEEVAESIVKALLNFKEIRDNQLN